MSAARTIPAYPSQVLDPRLFGEVIGRSARTARRILAADPFVKHTFVLRGRRCISYETILRHARTTRTRAGLRVRAQLVRRDFPTGVKISDAEMKALALAPNENLPAWNYTLTPRD